MRLTNDDSGCASMVEVVDAESEDLDVEFAVKYVLWMFRPSDVVDCFAYCYVHIPGDPEKKCRSLNRKCSKSMKFWEAVIFVFEKRYC